jgi:hypothetical protein
MQPDLAERVAIICADRALLNNIYTKPRIIDSVQSGCFDRRSAKDSLFCRSLSPILLEHRAETLFD